MAPSSAMAMVTPTAVANHGRLISRGSAYFRHRCHWRKRTSVHHSHDRTAL